MTMYQSAYAQGHPVRSDFLKFLSDESYNLDNKSMGSGSKGAKEIGAGDARLTVTALESGTVGNGFTIAIVNQGDGYVTAIGATTDNTNGTLVNGTYTNSGAGYASTTDGSGTGATYNVVIAAGVPTLVLNAVGSGYAATDTVVVAESTDFSSLATGTLNSAVSTVGTGLTNTLLSVATNYNTDPDATNQINFVVYPAVDGSGTVTSTANDVIAAINADNVAKLHIVGSIENGAGTSAVAAVAETALTGGAAGSVIKAGTVVAENSVTSLTVPYVVGGANGTGTITGILANQVDTTESEKTGVILMRGDATVQYSNLILPSDAVEATVKAALLALGIKSI